MSDKKFEFDELRGFVGSDQLYRHPLCHNVIYTPGVQHVAERAGAYWLIDKIATLQDDFMVAAEEFQVWQLFVSKGMTATLCCGDGNGKEVWREEIYYTDFPEPGISFYFENGTICLPQER